MRRKNVDPTAFRDLLANLELSSEEGSLPSPCVGICRVDTKTRFCEACFRTIDEIARWGGASDDDKRVIWQALRQRYEASLL
ncbi:hypothetical protein EV677_0112 [Herminiimonas fonticola]|uniref:Fe-S protein YdhL (DUF1289 family) n=2 Tax=Herminiimonas fonticola TaxID=303380 RepID=A0A4R6GFH6_9BURK|nr:DUF1289 domain-containing protein [Herminiimonas fonticola]RBA24466.1 Protein of unknown function (DUF1289) [Herminiimonas fonticola]TDN93583.1 hypothetical protein EV677_0112 [Herminiimonas fonticola]